MRKLISNVLLMICLLTRTLDNLEICSSWQLRTRRTSHGFVSLCREKSSSSCCTALSNFSDSYATPQRRRSLISGSYRSSRDQHSKANTRPSAATITDVSRPISNLRTLGCQRELVLPDIGYTKTYFSVQIILPCLRRSSEFSLSRQAKARQPTITSTTSRFYDRQAIYPTRRSTFCTECNLPCQLLRNLP